VDFRAGRVETLAGNGTQAPFGTTQADGPQAPLNSPWDVLLHRDAAGPAHLFVAMAGPHQLWVFDRKSGYGTVYAGGGGENLVDGPREEAQLAQPSGLATDGTDLYFVDSETSALRRVPLEGDEAAVETLIGEGLFEYGDVDGRYPEARLQHPLGLAFADGSIYVADTYNHKIKRYDPASRTLVDWLGTGVPGYRDGTFREAQLDEPGGLTVIDGRLYMADTNNHQIRVADLENGLMRTLTVAEMPLDTGTAPVRVLGVQTVAPGVASLTLAVALPDGFALNDLNPGLFSVASADSSVARPEGETPHRAAYRITVPFTFAPGETELTLDGTVYFCDLANGRCLLEPVALRLPLRVEPGSLGEGLTATLTIDPG
jgi:hypothetical protein